ncbi:uncharacterized protein LOC129767368 [Toxorhynchites rutilus septentrionalis]|uniref:uncharacterized protein LOC129767368 n=1 Tax=Toxorhynchites rutilus septentrionalis TaxID=329112 RepID=UPI002479DEFC|nr:uncharacterized protein LOC129767368 [Toxorhynchites rutilus septentrionalis]
MWLREVSGVSVVVLVLFSVTRAAMVEPEVFLTVKSGNLATMNFDDVYNAYLIVTDIMITPEGRPLPFMRGELDKSYFKGLQELRPNLKLLASFGGSAVSPEMFYHLTDNKRRAVFVRSLVHYVKNFGFSGVDIAWMYPTAADKERYVNLLKELRAACDQRKLILTVTVPSNPTVIGNNYPVNELQNAAHYVILATNEFKKVKKTSLIAPLYSLNAGSSNSLDFHVNSWKMAGLSSEKIVIVIQTDSLTYKLYQLNEYRLGTPVAKLKVRPYYKICQKLYSGSLEIFEEKARCPYAVRELNWYSYENKKSIMEKVQYAVDQAIGGIAVFDYDEDDPLNLCGDGSHPITNTILTSLQAVEKTTVSNDQPAMAQRSVGESEFDSYEKFAAMRLMEEEDPYAYESVPKAYADEEAHASSIGGCGFVAPAEPLNIIDEAPYVVQHRPAPVVAPPIVRAPIAVTTNPPMIYEFNEHELFDHPMVVKDSAPVLVQEEDDLIDDRFMEGDLSVLTGPKIAVPAKVEESDCPPVILANSDQAFALLNLPEGDACDTHLFSEHGAPASSSLLFSEPEQTVVIQPMPKAAQYCPGKSRIGFIATASTGVTESPQNCPRSLIRIVGTASIGSTEAPPKPVQIVPIVPIAPIVQPCQSLSTTGQIVSVGPSDSGQPLINIIATASASTPPPQQPFAELFTNMKNLASSLPQLAALKQNPLLIALNNQPTQPSSTICPYDGIIQDPLNPRYYFLCRSGQPMCDENRFACAEGYVFKQSCLKCVPIGASGCI